jgi:hypothetical protein
MKYELIPTNNRKSFYGKAFVEATDTEEILLSYNTPIIKRDKKTGSLTRLYDGWTSTTGNHIISFCGLNKKEFLAINME